MSNDLAVSICLVGGPEVGKTTFVKVVKESIFNEDYISTITKTYYEYERTVDNIRFHGNIIDFSGHELTDGNKSCFPQFLDGKIHIASGSASDQSHQIHRHVTSAVNRRKDCHDVSSVNESFTQILTK
ncbi:hypothetical protein EDI_193480 [Entamoeba dispar SAW760]|uniref:Uncharacterized protein n=1 Tax=Entamoeba dispar (strain ATCC PRA-260 / SAW760) TaxID=370354 RepID=B0EKD4_ENTDS|nr:uncharacterized protein EDI_193480 [Entamoeba dispar SAW760]EDR25021.1 hypothetical protein EDI_193480 [Entamoeba dispar SAW760]|eukprot:EDR25021.1 hypothetical protein EDI_193480 [Entamoeba dispar SAW760]